MKKFLLLVIGIVIISCSKNPAPKPDNLLDDEVMTNILFDIAVLQAAEGTMTYRLTENNIKVNTFIYEKYKIDSTTYYQNQKYYAANTRKYKKMHQDVLARLEKIKSESEIKKDSTAIDGTSVKN
ncbi:DUF4296 domain-containing protein [Flavobacterium sp. N2820]|jgi:hypothetical protein|uniref:DUF4296 domain-containing protein n=1 Tax=Flavobacterium sp. N2820 TaxID=2986834 RepID=UPI0022240A47|nr:DUF4296 domain-containing protein [Flavobacterium sp. N2820]